MPAATSAGIICYNFMRSNTLVFRKVVRRTAESLAMTPAVTTVLRRQPSVTLDRHRRNHLLKVPRAKKGSTDSRRHGVAPCAKQSVPIYNPDGYKARVREMWDKRALSYDSELTWRAPMSERIVALAELAPGATRLLDVASGTGSVALLAAQMLGPEGSVSALDVSEAMIAKVSFTKARQKVHCIVM